MTSGCQDALRVSMRQIVQQHQEGCNGCVMMLYIDGLIGQYVRAYNIVRCLLTAISVLI